MKVWKVICYVCGKEVMTSNNDAKFCSVVCKSKQQRIDGQKTIKCENCDKKIQTLKSKTKKFCNNRCSAAFWIKNGIGIYKKTNLYKIV